MSSPIILCALLVLLPQEPRDPTFGLQSNRLEIHDVAATEIGRMDRPQGRLRRVSWYQRSGMAVDLAPHWERRAVFVYDDAGHCIEREDWLLGSRHHRSRLVLDSQTGSSRLLNWNDQGTGSCSAIEDLTSPDDALTIRLVTPWLRDGFGPDGDPEIGSIVVHDSEGRSIRAWRQDGRPLEEVDLDEDGRIRMRRSWRHSVVASDVQEFQYDAAGRVRSFESRNEKSVHPRMQRTEYEYDAEGRLIRTCIRDGGAWHSTIACRYGSDGRLIGRTTWAPGSSDCESSEETFDGIDRPLTKTVLDRGGRPVAKVRWTYEDDARGNWTRRSSDIEFGSCSTDADALRVIEYRD